jgi:hypothetical protein
LVLNLFRALCLLLLASSAFADGPKCTPFGSSASGFKVTLAPTSNLTQWTANDGAYYVTSWWCAGKYAPSGWFYFGARSDLPANWISEIQKVPAASLDALTAAQAQYLTKSLSPEAKAAGEAQLAATKPALPVWVVMKNSSYTTRPMYRVQNGVRGATISTRAPVGAFCACNVLALEEGVASFCPLSAMELDRVTRCVPQ